MEHGIDQCKHIFVPWTWLSALLGTIVGGVGIVAYTYGSQMSSVKSKIENLDTRITKIENIGSDVDTVKRLIRDETRQLRLNMISRGLEP